MLCNDPAKPATPARTRPSSLHPLLLALLAGGLSGCGSGIVTPLGPAATVPTTAPAAVQGGAQLGYIWSDKTETLRPVLGVPGSTQLGESVVPADIYTSGAASPVTGLALLEESDGTLSRMALPSGAAVRVASASPGATIRFAPGGDTAIAFVPGAGTVTLLTKLTAATPQITTLSFEAPIAEVAVGDSGSVAAALTQSGGVSIRTMAAGAAGSSTAAAHLARLGGLAFVGAGDDLLLADAAAGTLTLVRNSVTAPAPVLLPTSGLLKTPTGVGVSRDSRWAVLANTGDAGIVRIDLTGATQPQRFVCACQPALVAQLAGTGVFRVTAADTGPAWMLDASAATPRVLFIPASVDANASETRKTGGN